MLPVIPMIVMFVRMVARPQLVRELGLDTLLSSL